MTFDRGRHETFEELISASLSGDLTADERTSLDAHLAGCDRCRATLAAFADGRRLMGGLRHIAPPRDLGARVRAGVERGATGSLPWWRRPPVIFAGIGGGLAAVTGVLLAIVLLGGTPDERPVGNVSPSPSASLTSSSTPAPTLPPVGTPAPTTTPLPAPSASDTPLPPTPTPVPAVPEPDVYLAVTGPFDNRALTIREGASGSTITEAETPSGPPIAAELSPDGQFLAYITRAGESGQHDVWVTRVADAPEREGDELPPVDSDLEIGASVLLGRSVSGSPFLERLSWSSPRPLYLAFTLADPGGDGTDVWLWEPSQWEAGAEEPARQLTATGNAYAGSWVPGGAGTSRLWVSLAADEPTSHLLAFHDDAGPVDDGPIDPAEASLGAATNVFAPLLSPNGALVIFWSGRMDRSGDEWLFSEGGAPWLAENRADGEGGYEFASARELFGDLVIGRDAFTSAAIAWGGDSDTYAVWRTEWTGTDQGRDDPYPDPSRVYFGHATDARRLTAVHAIDEADLPADAYVVDVAVAATGRHLLVTAGYPVPGTLAAPSADLFLITRNTGNAADEVERIDANDEGWWIGPAAFAP